MYTYLAKKVDSYSEKPCNFGANYSNLVLKLLKYLNCFHQVCVTATAAAPTADRVNKLAKSAAKL